MFDQIIHEVLGAKDQEAHQVESSIFRSLLSVGLLLLKLYFANQDQGDYGPSIETKQGIAKPVIRKGIFCRANELSYQVS